MPKGSQNKSTIQLIWAVALILAGGAVFLRIPQVMPQVEKIQQFEGIAGFIRFCFYLMGIILVGGGIKKLIRHLLPSQDTIRSNPDGKTADKESTR